MKMLFILFGHIFLLLGVVGIFLPLVPTTPFLLLATFFYSKGSSHFHQWLIQHKIFGSSIRRWEEKRAIHIKAKVLATLAIGLVVFFKILNLNIFIVIKMSIITILTGVLIFIWSRPSE
jgi:uncharacterized membrane protein YbaN (DUF454 family)